MDLALLLCRHLGAEAVDLSSTKKAQEVWKSFDFQQCERPKKRDPVRLEAL